MVGLLQLASIIYNTQYTLHTIPYIIQMTLYNFRLPMILGAINKR